jgi:hypothetical protein
VLFNAPMADRVLEPWETNAAGPFVTIRAGGPLDGVVTITAVPGGKGRNLVRASWRAQDGQACAESLEAATYAMARAIANAAANQFAVGKRPHLARD